MRSLFKYYLILTVETCEGRKSKRNGSRLQLIVTFSIYVIGTRNVS